MAAFLDSDENFMMYRRFGWIQSRLLLNKQNEISDLEKDLELEDGFPAKDEPINGEVTRYEGTSEYKQQILKDLEKKFCEYCEHPSSLLLTDRNC